jgi:hypothetical protein
MYQGLEESKTPTGFIEYDMGLAVFTKYIRETLNIS